MGSACRGRLEKPPKLEKYQTFKTATKRRVPLERHVSLPSGTPKLNQHRSKKVKIDTTLDETQNLRLAWQPKAKQMRQRHSAHDANV